MNQPQDSEACVECERLRHAWTIEAYKRPAPKCRLHAKQMLDSEPTSEIRKKILGKIRAAQYTPDDTYGHKLLIKLAQKQTDNIMKLIDAHTNAILEELEGKLPELPDFSRLELTEYIKGEYDGWQLLMTKVRAILKEARK